MVEEVLKDMNIHTESGLGEHFGVDNCAGVVGVARSLRV
jgi:hypothetical protein